MDKVSVIMLAYNRPKNIEKNVRKLISYDVIDDIFILYGHKDYKNNNIVDDKVIHVDNWEENDKMYLMRRYNVNNYSSVKNNCILLLDDDICPSRKLLDSMIKEYKKDHLNIYGPFKRYCGCDYYSTKFLHQLTTYLICIIIMITYYKKNIICIFILIIFVVMKCCIKRYNFILPGLCLTDKRVIQNCWKDIIKHRLFTKVIENKGNGEDLLFNHVFNKIYNKRPVYVGNGHIISFDTGNGFSTSNPYKHYLKRKNFCSDIKNI